MTTNYELVLSTEGVLAYFPMYFDGKDHTAQLLDIVASYNPRQPDVLSPSGQGAYRSNDHTVDSFAAVFSCEQPMNTQAVEIWARQDPNTNYDNRYGGILCFNALMAPENNHDRIILSIGIGSLEIRAYAQGRQGLGAFNIYPKSEFVIPHHCLMQYEMDSNQSIVYINGVNVHTWTGDIFEQLLPGGRITPAGFTANKSGYGNAFASDLALYDRALTAEEIQARLNAKKEEVGVFAVKQNSVDTITKNNTEQFVFKPGPEGGTYYRGDQHQFGYIDGVTTENDVPIGNVRVMCFDQKSKTLITETKSDAEGKYRLDWLLLKHTFLITAQYCNNDVNTPPEYLAVTNVMQTPTAYYRF